MKTPKETLDNLNNRGDFRQLTKFAQQETEQRQNDRERLWPLWEAMTEAYGRQFLTQYGPEPLPAWVAGLSPFTDQQIQEGYQNAILDNREFVPNLSVLIHYINGNQDWESKRLHRPVSKNLVTVDRGEGQYLEGPKDDRTPEEHIAEMRKNLGL